MATVATSRSTTVKSAGSLSVVGFSRRSSASATEPDETRVTVFNMTVFNMTVFNDASGAGAPDSAPREKGGNGRER